MKIFKAILISFVCLLLFIQNATSSEVNQKDSNAALEKRLEWFQDQKFGLFISYGIWCGGGAFGSPWQLCLDNLSKNRIPGWDYTIDVYRNAYWNLNKVFYPYNFDAEEWAKIAKEAGAKYFIFYTKHHDGFNMYDTHLSDYKITSPDCPYSDHPNPDYTARLFDACRKEGLAVGPCHSIADWHSPFYWKPYAPCPDRFENYDADKEPERWQKFVDFFHGQTRELVTKYGKIGILWLDGGWSIHYDRRIVQELGEMNPKRIDAGVSMHYRKQDLQMDRMVEMARSYQPELIVVERGGFRSGSKHENYLTPERQVPEKPLDKPWETWWTMRDSDFSTQKLIHLLVDIVCKGGNLLLCAPVTADGRITPSSVNCLKEMGEWLKVNGGAIYGTRMYSQSHFRDENICYTRKENYVYAIYLDEKQESKNQSGLPSQINIHYVSPVPGSKIDLIGVKEPVEWEAETDGVKITVPYSVIQSPPCKYAYSFRIQVSR